MANHLLHQGKDGPFRRDFTHWWVIDTKGNIKYRKTDEVQLVLADGFGSAPRTLFEIHQAPGLKRPVLLGSVVGASLITMLLGLSRFLA